MLFAVLGAVCLIIWFAHKNASGGTVAVVMVDDRVIRTIDLSDLSEPMEFTVDQIDGSYNIIRAEKGRIAVIDANCPDHTCIRQGYIEDGAYPIICLPHALTVQIMQKDDAPDAVSGGGLR